MGIIIDLLFPPRCMGCDCLTARGQQGICEECLPKIKYIRAPICAKCGKALRSSLEEICFDCNRKQHYFERGRALYEYGSIAPSLYRFKYQGRREYAAVFGRELAVYLGDVIRSWHPDGLVPVPLHKGRLRKRGYNQAFLLASAVSENMGIPVYDRLVVRNRNTTPQKELNLQQRQNNLKKAFHINRNDVKLSTIIIIDDIYTTGNTIDEVSRMLLQSGVKKVYYIALAIGAGL